MNYRHFFLVLLMMFIGSSAVLRANPIQTLQEGSLEEVRRDLSRARTDLSRDAFLWTPLMVAAGSNPHPEVIRFLVQSGQEINRVSLDGWTALHFAAAFNPEPLIVQTLVELGADLRLRSRDNWTLYYGASRYQDKTFTQQVRLPGSQSSGADLGLLIPQTLGMAGELPSYEGSVSVSDSRVLVDAWELADWEICDLLPAPEPGFDVVQWSQWFEDLEELEKIISSGSTHLAQPQNSYRRLPQHQGWSAIFFAGRFNPNPRVFEVLATLEDTPFQLDESGTSPLEYARLYNDELARFIQVSE